ncbi:MAG: hypothetical protein EKK41_08255 [Hyphomicrobiales bacterium]|nr:MAG: hypothetical protein EKK41_08255 [Hyphomicrobiales bacterium]
MRLSRQASFGVVLTAALLVPLGLAAQTSQPNAVGVRQAPPSGSQPARRGLRAGHVKSAQAPTPAPAPQPKQNPPAASPALPPAAAPLPPGAPKIQARGPEQEYQDCLTLWDKGTHMTKAEWATTCRRIQNRLTSLGQQTSQLNQGRRRVR